MKLKLMPIVLLAALAAGCDPVATSAASTDGGAAAGSPAVLVSTSTAPVAAPAAQEVRSPRDDEVRRVDSLERALRAKDDRVRELEQALATVADKGAAEVAALRKDLLAQIERVDQDHAQTRAALAQAQKTLDALRAASPLPNLGRDVPRIEGHVLSLERRKDGPVVLIDIGQRQGVAPKLEFAITRAGKTVATIAVERVEAEVSSGPILYSRDGELIAEGDVATTRP